MNKYDFGLIIYASPRTLASNFLGSETSFWGQKLPKLELEKTLVSSAFSSTCYQKDYLSIFLNVLTPKENVRWVPVNQVLKGGSE